MKFRMSSRQWVVGLFFTGIAVLLVSCQGPGGDECGGIETVTSCVTLSSIQPFDGATESSTSDVDVVQTLCPDGTVEPFTSHRADVTFNNMPFPEFVDLIGDGGGGEQGSLPITIRQVKVEYQLDFCPEGAVCPPLTGFTQPVVINIPAEGTVTQRLDFVPLSVKNEFVDQGGGFFDFPLYNVEYTFSGQTDFFNDSVEITGNAPFILGSFDNCPTEE
jgi:hypothetical protein